MAEFKPEAIAEKIVKGQPLSEAEWQFSRRRLESKLKRAARIKRPEFERIVKAKRYRELKKPVEEPKVYQRTRFERGMMVCAQRPMKVQMFDKYTGEKVHETVEVERRCPTFPEEDVSCYETAVTSHHLVEGRKPELCEEVKLALSCMGPMSPTILEGVTEIPKELVKSCLVKLTQETSARSKKPEEIPPPTLKKERERVLRESFLLDEPVYVPDPEKAKETLMKYEKLKEEVPV